MTGVRRQALAALALALGIGLGAAPAWSAVPTFDEVRRVWVPSDLTVVDRHGVPVQTVRVDTGARRLDWVPLTAMSPALLSAIVHSEDRRFWAHGGVDWRGVAASAWGNLWNTRTRGASTVTMQLAGLLDADLARPSQGRTVVAKVGQAWQARQLEARWRKTDILEAYLNLVSFRGELVGVHALSWTLFGKHPHGLDQREAAIAAALVRGPNATPAVVAQRACQVWQDMQAPVRPAPGAGCAALRLMTESALQRQGGAPPGDALAPHLARRLVQDARAAGWGGAARPWPARWTTPLDARIQRLALEALRRQLAELQHRQVEDGAVLVLDNATGEVRAWVGSGGSLSAARDVDGVLARRQSGSTLKPFVYELAFERRVLTPASLLHDAPVQLHTAAGMYRPRNYDHQFKGWVSVRQALGSSLNIPAVRAGVLLGPEALVQRFNALGLGLTQTGGFYGPGVALGSAEVTLLDLTNAYRSLARGGLWSPVRVHGDGSPLAQPVPRARRVLQADASHLVTDILADNNARAATFGLDSVLATRGFAAVKTGTSKDLRDNWCVGFSDRYTVGVWIGNASGEPMQQVSGVTGAAPIWSALMRELHRERPSRAPAPPPGLESLAVRFEGPGGAAVEPPRTEWFVVGTAQPVFRADAPVPRRAIDNPQDGSIYAIDPDMPPRTQRVVFSSALPSQRPQPALSWWLDGRRLGQGPQWAWMPWPGRHQLELRQGPVVLDRVQFEVRGAGVKPGAVPPR